MNKPFQISFEKTVDLITSNKNAIKKSDSFSIGILLSKRKDLFSKRKIIADSMFCLSLFSLILMITMIELLFYNPLNNKSIADKDLGTKKKSVFISQLIFVIRCLISVSTIALLFLVFLFHLIEFRIICVHNHTSNICSVITRRKLFIFFLELCVCAIHPFPSSFNFLQESLVPLTRQSASAVRPVPSVILLSVLMFLRMYQLSRVLVFHSKLVVNSSYQSLGYLNKVDLNFGFLFKSYMYSAPALVLLIISSSLFISSGWVLMVCEYPSNTEKFTYSNSLWLLAITFLTVGYGDMNPYTYCGRVVAVSAAILGVFWIAITVAIITQKLEFTRGEKYFFKYITELNLTKEYRNASADLLKNTWLHYRSKHKNQDLKEILKNEKLLQNSVQQVRRLKEKKREHNDQSIKLMMGMNESVSDKHKTASQQHYNLIVNDLENKIQNINIKLDKIYNLLEENKNK